MQCFALLRAPDNVIYYGNTFVVKYNGTVTGVSIMTPGASSQGTEQTQRMVFPLFVKSSGQLIITAPPDATILLQGYHMLFLLNGDTPSEAKWIRLGDVPTPTASPTYSPSTQPTVVHEIAPIVWSRLVGYGFNPTPLQFPSVSTYMNYSTATIDACEAICDKGPGCDFYTYNSVSNQCDLKFTDKTANMSTVFKGQTSGRIIGQLQFANIVNANPIVTTSTDACINLCSSTPACQFVVYDGTFPDAVQCTMKFFDTDPTTTIGFRLNPRPLNYNPTVLGRIDVIGNSGIVCIFANLLPDGRVLCGARPEYFRGGPNYDNVMAPFADPKEPSLIHYVMGGEIASIFDPLTGIHKPSPVDDNIFCHGSILAEDGTLFSAGGDGLTAPAGFVNGFEDGLFEGLNKMRWFDYRTEKWTYGKSMQATRSQATIVRLVNGSYVIIGGLTSGTTSQPQGSIEFYNPNLPNANTTLLFSEVLDFTGTSGYPKCYLIPGSGDIYIFAYNTFEVVSHITGLLVEREIWSTPDNGVTWVPYVAEGIRSGNYIAGNCLLPLWASRGYMAEIALFGGGNDNFDVNQTARNDVARMVITAPAPKRWTYDTDRMPYGRVVSDCTLQPNGKMLLTNGARLGFTGGIVGVPNMAAAANGTSIDHT